MHVPAIFSLFLLPFHPPPPHPSASITNLKLWTRSRSVIRGSLMLFQDLSVGFSSVRKLFKLDSIQFILSNHTVSRQANKPNHIIASLCLLSYSTFYLSTHSTRFHSCLRIICTFVHFLIIAPFLR